MGNCVVEVRDQFGGYIRSEKNPVTGLINVIIFSALTEEATEYWMDPKEPKMIDWLKGVYQPFHLEILLGEGAS